MLKVSSAHYSNEYAYMRVCVRNEILLYICDMGELKVRKARKLSKAECRHFTGPLSWLDSSDETRQLFVFRDGKRVVGGMMVDFESHRLIQGEIYLGVYISRFEVVASERGRGYGRAMLEWLVREYPINQIEISHKDFWIDDGAAYRFWRHMGFRKKDALTPLMYRRIKRG